MLLPTTYSAMMMALALSALLWGIWANTKQADRTWRFELYSFDFAIGALAVAVLLAYTAGSAGSANTFTFEDNLMVASKRNMAMAVGGGAIFCIGNILVLAGVALAGMSTALPVGAGMGLLAAVVVAVLSGTVADGKLVWGGAGMAVLAVLAAAMAQKAGVAEAPVKKGIHPGWKGFILSCVGGLVAGLGLPVVESSRGGEIGLGAYGAVVFMAVGMLALTPVVNVFFLNLPVQGTAGSPLEFFRGKWSQHLLGVAGGALWVGGTTALFASVGGGFAGAPKFLGIEAIGYGGAAIGALCGLTIWGEQAGAVKAKLLLLGAAALLAGGAALVFLGA